MFSIVSKTFKLNDKAFNNLSNFILAIDES